MTNKTISRRVFLGSMAYLVTAPVLAFSLDSGNKQNVNNVAKHGKYFDKLELTILADIAEIMIPRTSTPGATEAHVIPVLDSMMLTWAGSDTKARFKSLITQIQQIALDSHNLSYSQLPHSQRVRLMTNIDEQSFENKDSQLSINYRKFKEIVFHIYYTSEEANPDYLLIPGTYKGCLTKQEYDNMVNARLGRSA